MLVVTQKAHNTIHIGNDITVTILRVKGRAVKVGIDAFADVQVLRDGLVPAPMLVLKSDIPRVPQASTHQPVHKPR
jgi:carbon storage regulator CsrA